MPRDSSRDAILERAVQLASVQGLDGLTIGGLAAAMAMSKGGICAHFPAKAELQQAVVGRAAEIFRRAVVDPAFARPAGRARLAALMDAWFDYLAADTFEGGCFFTNALLELDHLDEVGARSGVTGQYGRYLDLLERLAAEGIERGELRAGVDPRQLAFELHSIQMGVLVWRALGRDHEAFERGREAARAALERSAA